MTFNPNWLIGKTVEQVDMRPFPCSPGDAQRTAHDPIIWFTDGSSIAFVTEETAAEYGTQIIYRKARR